jgi:hypothetical protein
MPRKLCVTVGGGMGDQICAEPVIRYMKEHWCADDEIVLMTQYPPIFEHLQVTCYDSPIQLTPDWLATSTHPDQEESEFFSFHNMHTVDYIALRLIRRQLPLAAKTIRNVVPADVRERVRKMLRGLKRPVLLHPGVSWESKNIPEDVWQSYADALVKAEFDPVVIGRRIFVGRNRDQIRDSLILLNGLNLVNRLDLQELAAALSEVPVLISNDSAPVHLAGAFDNWIGIIATCRNPSYLFPFRNGSQAYRTAALERYQLYEKFNFDPFNYSYWPIIDGTEDELRRAAPTPETVVEFVKKAYT